MGQPFDQGAFKLSYKLVDKGSFLSESVLKRLVLDIPEQLPKEF
jgi:hypothetical protein